MWTAPQYITAEDRYLVEEEERQRIQQERQARLRAEAEEKRAEIDACNAESRARALGKATAIEEKVRQLYRRAGSKLHDKLMERPDVQRAVAFLAREHDIPRNRGLELGRSPLGGRRATDQDRCVGSDRVLDPAPGRVNGDAFKLLAGMLLLFPTRQQQQRFERNTRRRRKVPIDGYQMEHMEDHPGDCVKPPAPAAPRCRRTAAPVPAPSRGWS